MSQSGMTSPEVSAPRVIVRRGQVTVIPAPYAGSRTVIRPDEQRRATLYARPGAVATEATSLLVKAFAKGGA